MRRYDTLERKKPRFSCGEERDMKIKENRVWWIDEVRGFALLAMVLHHIAFNITNFLRMPVPWLEKALESRAFFVVHTIFVAIFFCISGICCRFSKRPFSRAGKVLSGALAVTAVTYVLFGAEAIWFGVLHCLGVCMFLDALFAKKAGGTKPLRGIAVSLCLFFLTCRVPDGYILNIPLPDVLYKGGFWTAFGFPDSGFASMDYVPLLPHIFLFSAGVFAGRFSLKPGRMHSRFLAFCGQHSLALYLLHQPLLFGLFWAAEKILKG